LLVLKKVGFESSRVGAGAAWSRIKIFTWSRSRIEMVLVLFITIIILSWLPYTMEAAPLAVT
jgi:hypothetical protein